MTSDQLIITYFQLREQERKRSYADSGSIAVPDGKHFAVGRAHLAVLEDGRVIAMGNNRFGQCDVDGWSDIVKVAAGDYHTVALKKDGTVLAAGDNRYGQCNVDKWRDIVDVFAENEMTVGVKSDGSIVVTEEAKKPAERMINGEKVFQESVLRSGDLSSGKSDSKIEISEGLKVIVDEDCVSIAGCSNPGPVLTIPDHIRNMPVWIIRPMAFEDSEIEKINLPDTLQFIGASAFIDCNNLKEIRIPDSVQHIDNYAFWNCDSLETVIMSANIQYIGKSAFCQCPKLRKVYITEAAKKRLGFWNLRKSVDDTTVFAELNPEKAAE